MRIMKLVINYFFAGFYKKSEKVPLKMTFNELIY